MSALVKVRCKYRPESMASAIEAVRGGMPKRQAAKIFGVPRTTLLDKISGRVSEACGSGRIPVLTKAEEETLVRYIQLMSQIGYPICRMDLAAEVKKVLDNDGRPNPFRNNKPGKDWYKAFVKRNPAVVERVPQKLGRERACVTAEKIKNWYSSCQQYLIDEVPEWEQMLSDPRRVFNCDESGFPLSVSTGRVLSPRGARHVYQIVASNKLQLTVMEGMNAVGNYIPPMIVFPGQRIRDVGLEGYTEALYGRSDNGWMDTDLFLEYLKHFVDFVKSKDIHFPVILFVDGHSTHMTHSAATFCSENDVVLYCLVPNATHIMQPCDVGLFSQLKASWKREVRTWHMKHLGEVFTKKDFPGVYKDARERVCTVGNAISAFRNAGLFPFTIEGIDRTKLTQIENHVLPDHNTHVPPVIPKETAIAQPVTNSHPQPLTNSQPQQVMAQNLQDSTFLPKKTPIAQPVTNSQSQQVVTFSSVNSSVISDSNSSMSTIVSLQMPFSILSRNLKRKAILSSPSGDNYSADNTESLQVSQLNIPPPKMTSTPISNCGHLSSGHNGPSTPDSTSNHLTPSLSIIPLATPRNDSKYVSPSFEILTVPEIKNKRKANVARELIPKALSGKKALEWHARKQEEKRNEEEAKKMRKLEREQKKVQREAEKEKKHYESLMKKKEKQEQKNKRNEDKENKKPTKQNKKSKSANMKPKKRRAYSNDDDSNATDSDIPYMESDNDSDMEINPDLCGGCGMAEGDSGPEWVGCDRCPRFWHIRCTDDEIFQSFVSLEEIEDYIFHCKFCL